MKNYCTLTCSLIALAAAAPALAQGNSSTIIQGGTDGAVTVDQIGTDEESIVTQDGTEQEVFVEQAGSGNFSEVDQSADGIGDFAFVGQTGTNHRSTINQFSLNNDPANGVFPAVSVTQSGDANVSVVNQGGEGFLNWLFFPFPPVLTSSAPGVFITQGGADNLSTVDQDGQSTLTIVMQTGIDNISSISQTGQNNYAQVGQEGDENIATIFQSSTPLTTAQATAVITQPGNLNEATIIQNGLGGSDAPENSNPWATITQSGDDNAATTTQSGVQDNAFVVQSGDGNTSTIDQLALGGINTADVDQSGDDGSSQIIQSGGLGKVYVFQSGTGQSASIVQSSPIFDPIVFPLTGGGVAVDQSGSDNVAVVDQSAEGYGALRGSIFQVVLYASVVYPDLLDIQSNIVEIFQDGDRNTASAVQSGPGSFSRTRQIGNFNSASVLQNGVLGIAQNRQFGDRNLVETIQSSITASFYSGVEVGQTGSDNRATTLQDGTGSILTGFFTSPLLPITQVTQTGIGNASDVIQSGRDDRIFITQIGDGNRSSVVQDSAGVENLATVNQTGNLGISEVTQTGEVNFATLNQSGVGSQSFITQGGRSNTTTVTQAGSMNFSAVTQSGLGNVVTVNQGAP